MNILLGGQTLLEHGSGTVFQLPELGSSLGSASNSTGSAWRLGMQEVELSKWQWLVYRHQASHAAKCAVLILGRCSDTKGAACVDQLILVTVLTLLSA